MRESTPALRTTFNRLIRLRFDDLTMLVGDVFGLPASDSRVLRCAVCINAQIVAFRPGPFIEYLQQDASQAFEAADVRVHILAFSTGGIEAIRQAGTTAPNPARRSRRGKAL